jgi:hypothetical protein
LGQAWWRHIQNLGLSKDYRDQTEIGLFLKNIIWFTIIESRRCRKLYYWRFYIYNAETWEKRIYGLYYRKLYRFSGAKFPISMWAEMNSSSEKTTNACESFHSKYNPLFYTHHPDIYTFLEILKKIN